jgi:hypothetical protein
MPSKKAKPAKPKGRSDEALESEFDDSIWTTDDDVEQSTLTAKRAKELRRRAAKIRSQLSHACIGGVRPVSASGGVILGWLIHRAPAPVTASA